METALAILGLLSTGCAAGWWAHVIYAGRAARLNKGSRYWKAKYHATIKQRNEARDGVKIWTKRAVDLGFTHDKG